MRLLHKYVSVEAPALRSFELDLMIRALDLTMGHTPQQRLPVNLLTLKQICDICDTLGSIGLTFKFAFLAGFFLVFYGRSISPLEPLVILIDAATHVAATFSSDHPASLCYSSGQKQPDHSQIITSYPSPQSRTALYVQFAHINTWCMLHRHALRTTQKIKDFRIKLFNLSMVYMGIRFL